MLNKEFPYSHLPRHGLPLRAPIPPLACPADCGAISPSHLIVPSQRATFTAARPCHPRSPPLHQIGGAVPTTCPDSWSIEKSLSGHPVALGGRFGGAICQLVSTLKRKAPHASGSVQSPVCGQASHGGAGMSLMAWQRSSMVTTPASPRDSSRMPAPARGR